MLKKRIKILLISIGTLIVLGVLSWLTTSVTVEGVILPETWRIRVLDDKGKPVRGANLILDIPNYNPSARYVFQNYKGVGSITSNQDGLIILKNERPIPFGYDAWDLFWIYPMKENIWRIYSRYILISAPGYDTVVLSPIEIIEQKEMSVTLKKESSTTQPNKPLS